MKKFNLIIGIFAILWGIIGLAIGKKVSPLLCIIVGINSLLRS